MAEVGLDGRFLRVNPALCEMLGYGAEQLLTMTPVDVAHPDDGDRAAKAIAALGGGVSVQRAEKRYVRADGTVVWVALSAVPVLDEHGNVSYQLVHYLDLTERKEFEARLEHLATHDPLTGLPNRALLADRLSVALARADRAGQPIAALFVDLDGFKGVNDLYGHAAGDELLVQVAGRINDMTRPSDTVARLGGDEFVVVADGLTEIDAIALAERLRQAATARYHLSAGPARIGASVGVAMSWIGSTGDQLIAAADQSMYAVKAEHRHAQTTAPPLSA